METRLATSGNIAVGLGLKLVCSTLKLCNLHFEVLQFLSIYFGHLKVVTNGSQCGQGRDCSYSSISNFIIVSKAIEWLLVTILRPHVLTFPSFACVQLTY